MRGSPLFRTLVVLGVLLLTGLALARLTREVKPAPPMAPPPGEAVPTPSAGTKSANYELVLSAQATELALEAGGKPSSALSGTLDIAGGAPVISLRIKWADNSPGHRFAKLRLEIPGKDTLEHVFSAPGDIDDIWEP